MKNHQYAYITLAAPTTTVVASRQCTLDKIVINKATANGVITVYNGISAASPATAMAVITSPATLLQNQVTLDYGDICLDKGLTIVTSGAAQDITVSYSIQ